MLKMTRSGLTILLAGTVLTGAVRGDAAAASKPEVFKIGATVPLSGNKAKWGDLVVTSMKCSMDNLNKSGELGNVRMDIVIEDSKGMAGEGLSALRKLVSVDGLPLVFTIFTNIALAQAPVANDLEVVLFSSGVQHPDFGKKSKWTFRNAANTRHNADVLVRHLREKEGVDLKGLRYAAIMHSGNDATRLVSVRARQLFEKFGGEVVAVESFAAEDRDFRTQLTKIKALNPDVVHLLTLGTEIGLIINQMEEIGLKPRFRIAGSSSEVGELLKTSGQAAEGLLYSSPSFDLNSPDPEAQSFVQCYEKRLQTKPTGVAAAFYDGIQMVAEAIKNGADIKSSKSLRDHLAQIKVFEGISGRYEFLPSGDAWQSFSVGQVKDQKFQVIDANVLPYADIEPN